MRKGQKHSPQARAQMSASRKGYKHSEETKRKIGDANRRRVGAKNPRWQEDPSYWAVHVRIKKRKERTGICQHCGKKPKPDRFGRTTDFANISGEYKDDVNDYIELCKPCHTIYDGKAKANTP